MYIKYYQEYNFFLFFKFSHITWQLQVVQKYFSGNSTTKKNTGVIG